MSIYTNINNHRN